LEDNWTLHQAVNYVNSIGGIPLKNGQHAMVKLVVLDDQSSDTTSLNNYQTLITTDHASVLMGQLGTIDDLIAGNFASQHQIPLIGPYYLSAAKQCNPAPSCSNSWVFGTFHNETNEAHIFLNWFKTVDPSTSSHNVTIAFFEETDDSAQANYVSGKAYAQQLGYTVCTCSDTNFQGGSSSEAQSFVNAAKAAGAEAVFGLPSPGDAALLINTAKQVGYQPKAWLLTRGTAVAPFAVPQIGGIGPLASGVMSAFPWAPGLPYSADILGHNLSNPTIVNQYTSAHGGQLPTLEGVYYSGFAVAVDAISQADNLSNVAIRAALRANTYQTFMGPMSFSPGGQWVQSDQYMLMQQWQLVTVNGTAIPELKILEPTNVATTAFIIYPFTFANQTQVPWPPSGTSTATTSG
jgi:ABC-type branched-subunit amino acid transport system substrate-binding protein